MFDRFMYYLGEVKTKCIASICGYDSGVSWEHDFKYTTSADAQSGVDITYKSRPNQRIVIDDLIISTDTTLKLSIRNKKSGVVVAGLYLLSNSWGQLTLRDGIRADALNDSFQVITSAAGNITVTAAWHNED